MATFDEQLLKAAQNAFINNPDLQSYGTVSNGQYQTVGRNQISLPSRATVSNLEGLTGASSATPTSRGTTARLARSPGEIDAPPFDPPIFPPFNPSSGVTGYDQDSFTLGNLEGLTGQATPKVARTPTTMGQGGPTMTELDSRAFDAAMQDAADGNLNAIEEAFWGITNSELGGDEIITTNQNDDDDDDDDDDDNKSVDGPYGFGDQAALIQEQLGGLQTADLTSKITSLIDEARKGARSLNAETVRQIAAGYNLQEKQIEAIATAATETVKQTESMRTAAIDTLVADAATRVDQMVADQAANVASGTALAGPNQLTTEFAEVVTLTNALVNSVAVGAKSSMGRIQAVANIAAAQRMAAPALMMADAKNALGAERFALEGQAQMALEKTLNSLNVQEKEMVFNEALRIEQFNNNRDMALAQALINNGMAKLQYTIEEQRRDEDYARRQAEIAQQRADSAAAAQESRRRFELEFGLDLQKEARMQEAQDAATLAALSGDTSDMGEARAVAQKVYGPNPTESQIGALAAMSSAQRNTLLSDALGKTPAADLKSGTFESLVSEGFDEGVAMNAVTWVDTDRKAQVLAANIPQQYGYDMSDLGDKLKENPGMKINYADEVKDLDESVRDAAARDLEKFVDLQIANINMTNQYEDDFRTLTGGAATRSRMDFEGAINRINATTIFGIQQGKPVPDANPNQQAAVNPNWDLYTPYTTYVDTGSRAWLPS